MKTIERRIEKLENWGKPSREEMLRDQELRQRMAEGRERVRKAGIPVPSDEGLPPMKVHTSHGVQLTMDILNEGRDRCYLRSVRDEKLRQSITPATETTKCL